MYAFQHFIQILDDILDINYVYFENMVSQIYPSELQLNKANTSDTEAAFYMQVKESLLSQPSYVKKVMKLVTLIFEHTSYMAKV